jgi:NAD(P)-dependent dehydrogenase (short-subunit alcohol dehydrogenase family)
MRDFENKVAVVTGAASGIGNALAQKCLDEGMNVVLADIEEAALQRATEAFTAQGKNTVLPVRTDVSILEEIEALAEKAINEFGAVHLLFNNAGVGGAPSVLESTQADWEWVMGVNLWSVIHALRVFAPIMVAQDAEGHIVNTASMAGLVYGGGAYGVTKHGVVALSESAHFELEQIGSKVKVSVLCPGFVQTNITDSTRNRQERYGQAAPIELTEQQQARFQFFSEMINQGMPPAELADIVFDHIRREKLYILTHDNFNEMVEGRTRNILRGENPQPPNLT